MEAVMHQRIGIGFCAAVVVLLCMSTSITRSARLESAAAGPSAITPTIPVYLPVVQRPLVTPIPPIGACAAGALPPEEGAQAWVTKDPISAGQDQTLCVRLILSSESIAGATVTAVAQLPEHEAALGPVTTGVDGVATIVFNVGAVPGGTPTAVGVDATVTYNGATYFTTTCFDLNSLAKRQSPQLLGCG
jgi:hypothetical protein